MPHKADVSSRTAKGMGTVRQRTRKNKDGTTTKYWEGRVTVGYDAYGEQIQRSVSGKTQSEVVKKMNMLGSQVIEGTYLPPDKTTMSEWLDQWSALYLTNVKPSTVHIYMRNVELYIRPKLGSVQIQKLTKPMIQRFVNEIAASGISPKSVKDIHGLLHRLLEDAVEAEINKEKTE